MNEYFSDKEVGSKPRIAEDISVTVWEGIVGLINTELEKDSFAIEFPVNCPDGNLVCGTNGENLSSRLKAEIKDIEWPLQIKPKPDNLAIVDLIQFCYKYIGEAKTEYYHSYYKHKHLTFDRQEGKERFRNDINRIFARNGIVFELNDSGDVIRLVNPVFKEPMNNIVSYHEPVLDGLINDAIAGFKNPDIKIRKESLNKLWDAWERLKTIEPGNKKESIKKLLDKTASEHNFRSRLESEAKELTEIGNNFHIRHSETDKPEIKNKEHIDYLFYRMFTMINLILSAKKLTTEM